MCRSKIQLYRKSSFEVLAGRHVITLDKVELCLPEVWKRGRWAAFPRRNVGISSSLFRPLDTGSRKLPIETCEREPVLVVPTFDRNCGKTVCDSRRKCCL